MTAKTPWRFEYSEHQDFGEETIIVDADGKPVVGTVWYNGLHLALTEENARHIIACVNRCHPSTAQLQSLVHKAIDALQGVGCRHLADELADALEDTGYAAHLGWTPCSECMPKPGEYLVVYHGRRTVARCFLYEYKLGQFAPMFDLPFSETYVTHWRTLPQLPHTP